MVFKLVRTDVEDPFKIQLPEGTHLLGRGKFLDCDDKRISRSHGELQVSKDTVVIKALHQNPCFFIIRGSDETQILHQNNTQNLGNGDKFGLLPNSHWYEVLHCTLEDTISTILRESERERVYNDANTELVETVNNTDSDVTNSNNEQQNILHNEDDPVERPDSPSLLANQEAETLPVETENLPPPTENLPPLESPNTKSPKRSHSPQPVDADVKKIKTELGIKQEPADVQPGPSNDAGSSSNNVPDLPSSPVKPPNAPVGRERCFYGTSCYRRNPAHKAQYSHPGDADWGVGARGTCPRGAACASPHARHWATHLHPPGTHAPSHPPPGNPGMRVVERHGNIFYINAHTVNFYEDRFQVEDSDGDSVDFDYEF